MASKLDEHQMLKLKLVKAGGKKIVEQWPITASDALGLTSHAHLKKYAHT